ncbi:hypothetical protein [Nannocystis radixulma]|uniref:Ferritin-like domain-containing protein n=1 Tax=Nannocystis radixulma TaxID=2995305 RepID=A0ABT5BQB6_9BACT|nr:hypothetical protein [Nannocystis radixulma]MDC0675918.1 hypothetical protein [Nannocystis radixulma]
MSLDLFHERGTPLRRQVFSWKELAPEPISKLDDDAFTRVRLILMHGVEQDACRFKHVLSRGIHPDLRLSLAAIRRVEHHQATLINWMQPADQSLLETTIGYEQTAIEVTAYVARVEPDPYIAQVHRFGLLEDFDHLYRFAALMDRVEGKDANAILQSYTDISPGRATAVEHRAPADDLRRWYDRERAAPLTKIHAALLAGSEYQTRDFYLTIGPTFADPVARQLYAEIASIEEQHVTQYHSISDPDETWLEKWLVHEAMEAYAYWSCVAYERNPRVKAIWERFLDYELEHLRIAREIFEQVEGRDPASVIPTSLPDPLDFVSHRKFVRQVLAREVDLRTNGSEFVPLSSESKASLAYRTHMNRDGSPSEAVAAGYRWAPGTELTSLLIPAATSQLFKRASGA